MPADTHGLERPHHLRRFIAIFLSPSSIAIQHHITYANHQYNALPVFSHELDKIHSFATITATSNHFNSTLREDCKFRTAMSRLDRLTSLSSFQRTPEPPLHLRLIPQELLPSTSAIHEFAAAAICISEHFSNWKRDGAKIIEGMPHRILVEHPG